MSDDFKNQPPDIEDLGNQLEELLDEDDPADIDLDQVKTVVRKLPQTLTTRNLVDVIDKATQRDKSPDATDFDEIIGIGNAVLDELNK